MSNPKKRPTYTETLKAMSSDALKELRHELGRAAISQEMQLSTTRLKIGAVDQEKFRRLVDSMNPFGPREKAIGIARLKANPRSDELLVEKLRLVHISGGVEEDVYPEIAYDGVEILVTAGDRKGFADYHYREMGPDEPWIHPILVDWALHHKCYWEWSTETSIRLCKWANYDFERNLEP